MKKKRSARKPESPSQPGVPINGYVNSEERPGSPIVYIILNAFDAELSEEKVLSVALAYNRQNGNEFPKDTVRGIVRWTKNHR